MLVASGDSSLDEIIEATDEGIYMETNVLGP